jgi:hypothetical protein
MTGVEVAVIMAAASVAQGISEYQTGKANAKISKQNAAQSILNAQENERRQRMKSYISQGASKAIAGSSSLDAADLLESNAMVDELDALTIRHQGLVESINYRNQAKQQSGAAMTGLIKGFVGAGTSLYGAGGLSGAQKAGVSSFASGTGYGTGYDVYKSVNNPANAGIFG